MKTAFLVTLANWSIVQEGLGDPVVEVLWSARDVEEALANIDLEVPQLLVCEAIESLLTALIIAECDHRGVRLAALITSSEGERVAQQRGVGERVRQPLDLITIAGGEISRSEALGSLRAPAPVVAIWGPRGAPGRTTMAITVATLLAKRGHAAVLVDADARGGSVAAALGLLDDVPGFLAATRLARRKELNSSELERLLTRYLVHGATLHILTGLTRPLMRSEAPPASVEEVMALLRDRFDVVVVDVGSDLDGEADSGDAEPGPSTSLASHLLSLSHSVIAIAQASPVGVARLARELPDAKRIAGSATIRLWLNGVDPSRRVLRDEGVLAEALWRFAGVSDYASIPRDEGVHQAAMAGVTLSEIPGRHHLLGALEGEIDSMSRGWGLHTGDAGRKVEARQGVKPLQPSPLTPGVWLAQAWRKLTALR